MRNGVFCGVKEWDVTYRIGTQEKRHHSQSHARWILYWFNDYKLVYFSLTTE